MSNMLVKSNEDTEQRVQTYIDNVFNQIMARDPHETEFHQSVDLIFRSIKPALVKHPEYIEHRILEQITEPERVITFRVPWTDDDGIIQVNRGFRVQFNSAIGPYKGGLRFHPTVNSSIVKFLGFQQVLKNALTGQPIGGGKGGADFDPKGKSDREIMRFCQSFMTELSQHIGPDVDVPAGDIGVGKREIGYMFGQFKKLRGRFEASAITGKSINFGGSLARKEATGYGAVYFVDTMMKDQGLSLSGKRVVVSGSGNVSIYAMEKAINLGAKVVACSDSDGYIHDENGINLDTIKQLKEVEQRRICDYQSYHPDAYFSEDCIDIWTIPCDVALPCATQNEIDQQAAQSLIDNGVKVVAEGANMPSTPKATKLFIDSHILYAPAKAVNAGGVAVSSLEMAQNSSRITWTFEEVDKKLQDIMSDIYYNCKEAAQTYGAPGNLVVGANIAGFVKVADSMIQQGVI